MSGQSGRSRRVILVDTGMGNIKNLVWALERTGASVSLTHDPKRVASAERLVFPGQGAFGPFARKLREGLGDAIRAFVRTERPYLGICLGLQVLFDGSEEAPGEPGLGVLPGRVKRFASGMVDETGRKLKVPHMGWSLVEADHPLLPAREWFYFVHSYFCAPDDDAVNVGRAHYGGSFCAAVGKGPLFGVQFHPETSQRAGAALLGRFMEASWS